MMDSEMDWEELCDRYMKGLILREKMGVLDKYCVEVGEYRSYYGLDMGKSRVYEHIGWQTLRKAVIDQQYTEPILRFLAVTTPVDLFRSLVPVYGTLAPKPEDITQNARQRLKDLGEYMRTTKQTKD